SIQRGGLWLFDDFRRPRLDGTQRGAVQDVYLIKTKRAFEDCYVVNRTIENPVIQSPPWLVANFGTYAKCLSRMSTEIDSRVQRASGADVQSGFRWLNDYGNE